MARKPKPIVREIKGELELRRTGQGRATFKVISDEIISNAVVQLPASILTADYDPDKHDVTGVVIYTITITKK